MTELDLDLARQVLAAQPFSVLLGAQLTRFGRGRDRTRCAARRATAPAGRRRARRRRRLRRRQRAHLCPRRRGRPGGLDREVKANYLRGVRGEALVARAEVVHAGSRLVVARCDLFDRTGDGERRCATAQGMVALR